MSQKLVIFVAILLVACATLFQQSKGQQSENRLTAASLADHPPIGALRLPLETYCEISAVVAGQGGGAHKDSRGYLLEVTAVNGHDLRKPVRIEFEKPSFIHADLASDAFGLYELKNGKKTGSLNEAEIAALERGYIGRTASCVFETGGYSGIPAGLPKDIVSWQDHGFTFRCSSLLLRKAVAAAT